MCPCLLICFYTPPTHFHHPAPCPDHLPGFCVQTRNLFHFSVHLQKLWDSRKSQRSFFFYDKYPIVSIRYFLGGVFQGLLKFSALRCCRTKIRCEMATWTACMYICPPQNFSTQFLLYTAHVCHLHVNLLFPRSLSEYIYFHSSPSWSIKLISSPVFWSSVKEYLFHRFFSPINFIRRSMNNQRKKKSSLVRTW